MPCWAIFKPELTQMKGSVLANAEISMEASSASASAFPNKLTWV